MNKSKFTPTTINLSAPRRLNIVFIRMDVVTPPAYHFNPNFRQEESFNYLNISYE